jgi:Tfp pilus assembly protein PilO
MNFSALRTRIAYLIRRGGWPSWIGLMCLAVMSVVYFAEVLPESSRLSELQLRKDALVAQQSLDGGVVKLTPSQQLAEFYRGFPLGTTIPDVLARINQVAIDQQLALEFGEYAMAREQGGRLDQFRITLPIKGRYVQIRKFIAEVMLAHPSLSLESLSVRREKVAQEMIEGRIVFLLFLEHAP